MLIAILKLLGLLAFLGVLLQRTNCCETLNTNYVTQDTVDLFWVNQNRGCLAKKKRIFVQHDMLRITHLAVNVTRSGWQQIRP